eukprot:8743746-Ditylum_brightwellii.AAC.1
MELLDLESTEQSQCNYLFPVAVAFTNHGHSQLGTMSHISKLHIRNGEDNYLTREDAHHLNSDHNTTFKKYSKGSTNGNVPSKNISSDGRESPHIAKR